MIKKIVISLVLPLVLASCGIKGGLYLPDDQGISIPPQDGKQYTNS